MGKVRTSSPLPTPAAGSGSNVAAGAVKEAGALFHELMMSQRRHFQDVVGEFGLSGPQAAVLGHLDPERPCAMSTVAESMHCDASNITGLVDKLEARGILQRQPSSEDRRVKLLALTDEGKSVRDRLLNRVREPSPWMLALDEADQIALRDILQRALARLK
jgi:DNA-binding MarR family transcriptional regulator